MKHEPQKFGSAETFFLSFMQNYSCTQLVTVNHRRPFSNSSGGEEGGGVSVHRLVKLGKHVQTDLH